MKLTHSEQAIWSVVEVALKNTEKAKAGDAIRANEERIEAKTDTHACTLYKMANGTPAFSAKPLGSGTGVQLSGFKLIQKANAIQDKASGALGGTAGAGNANLRASSGDAADRNKPIGLMRRQSGG